MLSILINFIFTIISKVGDLILLPIVSLINTLIPSFSDFYNGILTFIDYAFTYILFFIKLLCIPKACISILVVVATSYFTIVLGIRAYILVQKIYEKFKP